MIVGIGVDLVDVPRFVRSIDRTPGLVERLFAEGERSRSPRSLAARFAAKEALIKALGDSSGFRWHDMEVVNDVDGKPSFRLDGEVAAAATHRGVTDIHLSLSHDGDSACAFVVAEAAT
ncbi:holo-ACP synthase [Agreia sp. COWG]|uniref:holo-ACP synthase n=1 Tax=Agreia sp. COWG TaxID=2773266 RepID=UPI0019264FB0|nr:holo-ACP synthase [Agreia sp. COWG]CAD6004320.1 Holo-[acyl-carrier-protein] synthase [Agreia sp. COWG]